MHDNLKKFLEITLNDPLFAAEGMDTDSAELAVQDLEHGLKELEGVWRPSYRWFLFWYPFGQTLHPVAFLKEFVMSEKVRREFILAPSEKNARRILTQYKKTLLEYKRGIEGYREALGAAQKKESFPSDASFQFFHRVITFQEILDIFEKFKENSKELRKEINRRSEILAGNPDLSNRHPSQNLIPQADSIHSPQANSNSELSAQSIKILKILEQNRSVKERYGPIFYSTPNFDVSPHTHQFFTYILNSGKKEKFDLKMTDQYYYLDIGEEKNTSSYDKTPYRPLIRRKIRYWLQPPTAWYASFDLAYYADIATICDMHYRRPFLPKATVLNQKSSMLDLIFETGADGVRQYAIMSRYMARENKLPPLSFLYITRGCPSIYFLPFNQSVWRLSQSPNFLGAKINPSSHFKNFEEIAETLSDREIEEIARGGEYRHEDYITTPKEETTC